MFFNKLLGKVSLFSPLLFVLASCGGTDPQSDAKLEAAHEVLPLKVDVQDFSKFDNPMLAEELVNQLATSLNFYIDAPFAEKVKTPTNGSPWLKLTSISMNNTGRTNVESKNNLKIDVKGGLFKGGVTVNYSLKQKYYAITLKFEDYSGNLYRFPFYLWVNEETVVQVNGTLDLKVGLEVLAALPGDVGHSMVSGLGELFTISGTSDNKFEWYEALAPMMKPLLPGIVSKFQVQIIADVFVPLCRKMNENNGTALDCSLPKLEPSNVAEALTKKLKEWEDDQKASAKAPGASSTRLELQDDEFYSSSYVGKNSIDSKAFYASRCADSGLKSYAGYRYNIFVPMLNGKLGLDERRMLSLYLRKKGGWERVPYASGSVHLVQETAKSNCHYFEGEPMQCLAYYLDVSSYDKSKFDQICAFVNTHGSNLNAGIGISFQNQLLINDTNSFDDSTQLFF